DQTSPGVPADLPGPHQIEWATSATSSSLRTCTSSSVRLAPGRVEENPHWVEMPSRSSPVYLAASCTRAVISAGSSSLVVLLEIRPRTIALSSGALASGSKDPERSSSYSRRNTSKLVRRENIASAVVSYPPAPIHWLMLLPLQTWIPKVTPGMSPTLLKMS